MSTWVGERSSMSRRASKQNTIAKIAIGLALAVGLGGSACVIYVDEGGDNEGPTPHHHPADARVAPRIDAVIASSDAATPSERIDATVIVDAQTVPDAAPDIDADVADANVADAEVADANVDVLMIADAGVADAQSIDAPPAQPGCPTAAECAVCGSSCVAMDECETGGFDELCFSCGVSIVETFDPSDWQTECGE